MTKSRTVEVNVTQSTLVGQTAQATADSAAGGVASLNNPNLMGVIEKQRLAIQMDNFATIYAADKDIATSEGIDFTAYDAAYHAYLTYMTPLVSDMTTYSPIVRATFNSLVTAVQAEQKRFNAATQAQYNQQINKAKTDISDGQTKYKALQSEAETMKSSAADIADKANRLASQYDDTNSLASQAFEKASSAQIDASSAVYKAESTASEFGKVGQKADSAFANAMSAESNASSAVAAANSTASAFGPVSQKADSAFANAMSAQNVASSAVEQALSAAADSKDAKQIAGAVSQSYKTLTDGSTMTIAELQNGLGAKLTKTDLNGYATQDWSQNQIRMTANGINETISSIKGTVDSHTTSINDFQADSEKFKAQFTTVNGTLDKQSTDISTLQASSKELSSNFSSLTTDNNTNKNDISELKQTATKLSSTMETVQTQVQNSAVGANLIVQSELKSGYLDPSTGSVQSSSIDFNSDYIATNGATVFTFSSPDYVFKGNGADDRIAMYNSNKNYLGYQSLASPTQTLSNSNVAYIRFSINFTDEGGTTGNLSDWLANHRYKLEKGSIATDWCPNPEDTATVTAVSKLSQTVDGFKTDISKKIEQKDLNGYATQDWAQNQIKTTADGINGTISSIKGTVDSHTTSINDFQADSEKFKAQFTTYKDTVDKHDRDISTLQADSKSLSSNFDSLNTANGTNEHHISELQQTAKDFSSTLETVQTQVQNSAVGTNLLTNTSDLSANWSLTGIVDTSQKPAVLHYPTTTLTSSVNNIANQQLNDGLFQPSTTYTASFHAKGAGTFIFYCWPSVSGGGGDNLTNIKLTSDYKLYTITFTTNPDISGGKNFLLRQDYSSSDPDQNTVEAYVYGLKLEKGSLATDWCPNPADNATVTAVSKLSQTVDGFQTDISKKIEQKDLNGYATETWSNNQIKLTADGINGAISSVKNIVDDHTTSIHDIQADSKEFKSQFTTYKDTVDRHDTDISTLQRDSKSLSSNFDSLDSDNKTNQHNIGQLQQSAKEFNSTMETVQTQVQNSAVGTNLLSNSKGKFQPNVSRIDNYIVYSNTPAVSIYMTQGQQYTVHANASSGLVWSGTHNPSVESNNVVLWVVNGTSVNTIISDANTGTGTTFTWNNPSGTYYLRVNTYKSDNSGYVENVKIEKGSLATDWCANPADNATVTAVSKISQTVNGFQTTISDKVSSSQLTELSGQLTNQIKDLASKTDSSFRQTANDINGMVKKGDVVNQFNLDAGGALLSTSGNSTKIVFSSPNILFDSANPVQIPNANIPGKLTGKTFEAGTITATTKITGSDIEAPIIHSPSGSFKLDGKTGDIIGASIHSANNSWGIDKDGNINGVNIVANTFNTNNGTFQVDSNGVVTANNLIIRNLVYNASLLGGNGNTIPGWSISNNGYYASNMVHDGVPSIEWNNTTGAGVWTNFAQTKLYPLNGLAGLPFSASVWFLEMGSDTSLLYQVTLAFFDSNGNRINGGFVGNTWNGISSRQDWRYVTIDNAVAPSNAISVGLQYWAYNGKGNAEFSSPMLTQTAHSTGYQPDTGNIVSAGIINGSVINGSTINGTTFNAGNKLNQYGNTNYPLTISSDGSLNNTTFKTIDTETAALRTSLKDGTLITNLRGMTPFDTGKYSATDTALGAGQLALFAGYSTSQDPNFSATGLNKTGYVILDAGTGLSLHGDTQSIYFNGLSTDISPKGIAFTPYGNINATGTQGTWYLGHDNSLQTANFGIDSAGSNPIKFSRNTTIGNLFLGTGHTIAMVDGSPLYFNKTDSTGSRVDIYAGDVHYTSLVKSSLLSVKKDVQKADTAYWAQLVNSIDLATYQYKTDDNMSHIRLSSIVDDVNDTKQWRLPDVFISRDENGKLNGVDDSVLLNATLATVQEQQKEIDQLNGHLLELEAKLNG